MKYKDTRIDVTTNELDEIKTNPLYSSNLLSKDSVNIDDCKGNKMDELQAAVVNAGTKIVKSMEENNLVAQGGVIKIKQAINELDHYTYNIGFAGEQSGGKSTVINSLIQYPLMPTCNLTTTSNCVKLVYGKKIRVTIIDDDTKKCVCDLDCEKISNEKFCSLKEYACTAMPVLVIENMNYFTEQSIFVGGTSLQSSDLDMDVHNSKHIAVLALVLFAAYIGQNDLNLTAEKEKIIEKRKETMRLFGIPKETINYSIIVQWDCELLKKGLVITDLPGLGAYAGEKNVDGKTLKSHDDITREAIQEVDAMVFIEDCTVKDVGVRALREMLSSTKLKEVVNKGNRVIPILNKVDLLEETQIETSQKKFVELLLGAGVHKSDSEIISYSAIFGEYMFENIPFKRTLFYAKEYPKRCKQIHEKAKRKKCSEEELKRELIEDLRYELECQYHDSGIEQLREFFLTTYVNVGKYNKAVIAVQMIKNLALQESSSLKGRAEIYLGFNDIIDKDIKKEMISKQKSLVKNLIDRSIKELIDTEKNKLKDVENNLNKIPDLYMEILKTALKDYQKQLRSITKEFHLTWKGLGGKAQINILGSKNRELYFQFLDQIEKLSVDVVPVNQEYAKILDDIQNYIDERYQLVLKQLEDFRDNLDCYIKKEREDRKNNENINDILNSIDDWEKTILTYIQNQSDSMKTDLNNKKKDITDVGNDVVGGMITLNGTITNDFIDIIKNDMKQFVKKGLLFSKREYLIIEGEGGLNEKIDLLVLDDQLENKIKTDIKLNGSKHVLKNTIKNWIVQVNDFNTIFTDLNDEIEKTIKSVEDDLDDHITGNTEKYEEMLEKAHLWEQLIKQLDLDIQGYFGTSPEHIGDTD